MTNDIMTVESKFFASLGNGVLAGELLEQMIRSVVQSRDTTVLVRAMDRARNKKADEQAAQTIALVVGQVWEGARVTKDKNGIPRITIKGKEANGKALARLAEATKKGLSIRHAAYRKMVKGEEGKQEFDLQKSSLALAKREQRAGVSKAAAMAAFDAAWEEALKSSK